MNVRTCFRKSRRRFSGEKHNHGRSVIRELLADDARRQRPFARHPAVIPGLAGDPSKPMADAIDLVRIDRGNGKYKQRCRRF